MVGYLAYSIAGRDKDKVYIIIREEPDYVWLVDGSSRKLDNPKRKNKKHICHTLRMISSKGKIII